MEPIRAIKGTVDILPARMAAWHRIESVVREVMHRFGYGEIRTPIFEETGLFARSIGEDTDIVGKEMYTFRDMGDRSLTLRPEGTASVVRAFIEHRLDQQGLPQKLWYMGPMFRQERPQKGRQRQFHQFGVEVIGPSIPLVDAEVMHLFDTIAAELELNDRVFLINCLGGEESREAYKSALVSFLDTVSEKLCVDCRRRKDTNPLRVLDCKVPGCKEALATDAVPKTVDHLIDADRAGFEEVQEHLTRLGVAFEVSYRLVRGLDYYTGTVFEMQYTGLGAQSAIMGGGRYNRLVGELGGPDLPAVGFACGIERLILAMEAAGKLPADGGIDAFVVMFEPSNSDYHARALDTVTALRSAGIAADLDYMTRSMKAQMKAASRSGARFAVIIEPEADMVSVKDLAASSQETMTIQDCMKYISQNMKEITE